MACMEFSLQKKIEEIRRQPEDVRKRYALGAVSFSMVFVFGIWLLAMQDNVAVVAKDVPATLEKGKDMTGGTPSLHDLFQQSAPLRIDDKNNNITGKEFFDQQHQSEKGFPSQ